MPVQALTNEEKAKKLLQGCLYREQGYDMAYRLKPGLVGFDAWRDDPLFGDNKEGRALLQPGQDVLAVVCTMHNRFYMAQIPLESIEILEK